MADRPFRHAAGALRCDGAGIAELADEYGTPLYVYSARAIRDAYRELDASWGALPHRVLYSVKACPNLAVCVLLAELGAGADVTSGGELARALRAGFDPASIAFAGVGKTREEITEGIEAGIGLWSVESEGELRALSAIASARDVDAPVALRVNPDVDARTHPHVTTGRGGDKFGVPLADAPRLYELVAALPGIRVEGVGMHIGSQLMDLTPLARAARSLAELARELIARGHPLRSFDIGGGYAIAYGDEAPQPVSRLAQEIVPTVRALGLTLLMAPGRRLVGSAGALVVRALYRKCAGGRDVIVVDAGMNALLRPALYGAHHRIVAIRDGADRIDADVAGPVCESADYLSRGGAVPDVAPGELLAVLDAGAYGFAMASEYNSRPRPAEVIVDGAAARLVRRRQTYDEMMAPELGRLREE